MMAKRRHKRLTLTNSDFVEATLVVVSSLTGFFLFIKFILAFYSLYGLFNGPAKILLGVGFVIYLYVLYNFIRLITDYFKSLKKEGSSSDG